MKTGPLCAVVFDFDGTLTLPGALDLPRVKAELGCPADSSILEFLESLDDAAFRERAEAVLCAYETEAAAASRERPSAGELIRYIRRHGLKTGIITRNTRASVLRALENCRGFSLEDFSLLLTRESPFPVKPEPDGVRYAAQVFGTTPERLLMVGDYIYDIEAGNRAGASTAFLDALPDRAFPVPKADYVVRDLAELRGIIAARLEP
jgi:hydrogenase expression/formation protein HypE